MLRRRVIWRSALAIVSVSMAVKPMWGFRRTICLKRTQVRLRRGARDKMLLDPPLSGAYAVCRCCISLICRNVLCMCRAIRPRLPAMQRCGWRKAMVLWLRYHEYVCTNGACGNHRLARKAAEPTTGGRGSVIWPSEKVLNVTTFVKSCYDAKLKGEGFRPWL